MTKPRRIAALACALLGLVPGFQPARGQSEPLIQPGAAVRLSTGAFGQPCTLSFVFRDRRHTYIGSVARCTTRLGERASMADREFGTVVFIASYTFSGPLDTPAHYDDFALIQVDDSQLHRVSPVVLDLGQAPRGVTTADQTTEGDLMSMTGQGAGYREGPTRHRRGALISDDRTGFSLAIPAGFGDGGSPVLDANLNAYGVLSSSLGSQGPHGMTIEYILQLLQKAGFNVELVTK